MFLGRALLGLAFAVVVATPAAAEAIFLTSDSGYTGPRLDLSAFEPAPIGDEDEGPPPFSSRGPVALPGGISVSAVDPFAIGRFETSLDRNGTITTLHIASGTGGNAITFRFRDGVGQFGVFMNFVRGPKFALCGCAPGIRAYDMAGDLVAFNRLVGAVDVNTLGQSDAFAFRGFDGNGIRLGAVVFTDAAMVFRGDTVAAVPEPASWAMLIAGFGLVGTAMRRRTTSLAVS